MMILLAGCISLRGSCFAGYTNANGVVHRRVIKLVLEFVQMDAWRRGSCYTGGARFDPRGAFCRSPQVRGVGGLPSKFACNKTVVSVCYGDRMKEIKFGN